MAFSASTPIATVQTLRDTLLKAYQETELYLSNSRNTAREAQLVTATAAATAAITASNA